MADTLEIFGTEYTNVAGIKATDDNNQTKTYIRPQGTKSIASNGTGIDVTAYASVDVAVPSSQPSLQSKSYTVTEDGTETITADSGYDGLSSVSVSVPAAEIGEPYFTGTFATEGNQRIWVAEGGINVDEAGWINNASIVCVDTDYNAVPANTTITPSTSAQTIGGANYMMEGAVTVSAMPSGTAGTPTATKGTVSNHSVSVTPSVTNTTGYITGSTKTGTAVTVSASELVSGTYTVDSSGTKDVTNYASASVPAMTLPTTGSTTSTGTRKAIVQAMDSMVQYINIPTGYNSSATYYEISQLILGTKTITQNGTYIADNDDLQGYGAVTVNVSGGGTPMHVEDLPDSVTSVASSISFTGLSGEPKAFWFMLDNNISTGTPSKIAAVVYDGTDLHAQTITNTSNAQVTYDGASLSKSYSNGTLTITSSGASFVTNDIYYGAYVYGGGAIDTKDVQVGSGATSITFTGLEDEPETWSCIFKSDFGTSSGYQRTIYVGKTENGTSGFEMDSAAHNAVHWTSSYSNGSFTITSSGTNAGGYFHQPGYYQLTYAYDDGSGGNYQTKSVTYTPSTSQQTQTITADSQYDALKKVNVTVNAMPTMTLPTASSATSSGTSKATITPSSSTQYLNIPTGYNGTAQYYTISAASGSSKNVQVNQSTTRTSQGSLTKVNGDVTVSKTGTYDVYWTAMRSATSSGYTWGSQLYVGGSAYGTENTTWSNHVQNNHLSNVSLTADQKIAVYTRGRTGSYYTYAPMLVIVEA